MRDPTSAGRRSIGATLAAQNTIAVLPFADHSPGHDLDYFCQGLRQETIHRLAKLEALRVLTLQPGEPSAHTAADEQTSHAAMLLTGGVRKSGDRLRITIHLVDNATASYLWSESIDAGADDVFAAQEARRGRRRQEARAEARSMPATGAAAGDRRRTWRRATSICRGAIT